MAGRMAFRARGTMPYPSGSQSDIQENPIPEEFDHLEKGRIGAGVRFQF
jgi:hypothetical protein